MSVKAFASLLLFSGALLLGLSLVLVWLMVRHERPARSIPHILLRVSIILLLAVLARKSLFNFRTTDKTELRHEHHLVVLVDASESMQTSTGGSATRADHAAELVREIRRRTASQDIDLTPLYFARNLVEEDERDRLLPDATNLDQALGQALSRLRATELLILSDGAATSGAVPELLVEHARRAKVGVYAICVDADDDPGMDLFIEQLDADRRNPSVIKAIIRKVGRYNSPVAVELRLNGVPLKTVRRRLEERTEIVFCLPDLVRGWHAFEVAIAPVSGELTVLNNARPGIFEKTTREKFLFVHGAPRLENRHLIRQLRIQFPDRLTVMTQDDPELGSLDMSDYVLAVLADIDAVRLPANLDQAMQGRSCAFLILAGPNLKTWQDRARTGFPASRIGDYINLRDQAFAPARVMAPLNLPRPLDRLQTDHLQVNLFYQVQPSKGARTLLQLNVDTGAQIMPLALTDNLRNPDMALILTDTTWKWGRHPDPCVRREHDALWDILINWLLAGRVLHHGLLMDIDERADVLGRRRILARAAARRDQPLSRVQLTIEEQAGKRAEPMSAENGDYTFEYRPEPGESIVWFQATGRQDGERIASERKPMIAGSIGPERAAMFSRPDLLEALTGRNPRRFAFYGEHEPVFNELVASLEPKVYEKRIRLRHITIEMILAGAIFMLAAVEWFLEQAG